MSWTPAKDPICTHDDTSSPVELIIEPRRRDLGGVIVGRVLPSRERRAIGPFIFLDHMGPVKFEPGSGIDVPPHPHINLATVTYLFDGEIIHRDSLGSLQAIRPGELNWMTAGRGIVHSERSSPERRESGARLHGIQLWVALPEAHEEMAPEFHHHAQDALPLIEQDGARIRLLLGSAYGRTSPVRGYSPMFYADVEAQAGASIPIPAEQPERACYLVEGALSCGAEQFAAPCLMVFAPHSHPILTAHREARFILLGGAPVGPRHMWWNFVSSSRERIDAAKVAWKEQRFPKVPGDDVEFVPLPEL